MRSAHGPGTTLPRPSVVFALSLFRSCVLVMVAVPITHLLPTVTRVNFHVGDPYTHQPFPDRPKLPSHNLQPLFLVPQKLYVVLFSLTPTLPLSVSCCTHPLALCIPASSRPLVTSLSTCDIHPRVQVPAT